MEVQIQISRVYKNLIQFNFFIPTEQPNDQEIQLEEEWMEHTGRRLPEGCKRTYSFTV